MGYCCNKETHQCLKEYAVRLLSFINHYKWLSEAYIVEFFVKDHWSNLPRTWLTVLEDLDTVDISCMLLESPRDDRSIKYSKVWPLSLLAYRATVHAIALRRTPQDGRDDDAVEHLLKKTSTSYEHLSRHYRRHVKPKKQYEICRLARLIHETCQKSDCNNVVDVGAGMGHLTRLLSFGYGLHVTTVEAEGGHVGGAIQLDDKLKKFFETKSVENPDKLKGFKQSDCSPDVPVVPNHVIFHIDPNIAVDDFLDLLQQHRGSTESSNSEQTVTTKLKLPDTQAREPAQLDINQSQLDSERSIDLSVCCQQGSTHSQSSRPTEFGFVGLHTCGDLAPTILSVFSKCSSANALVSVGCCYQKLTCRNAVPARRPNESDHENDTTTKKEMSDSENPQTAVNNQKIGQVGYPMSDWIRSLPDYELNYESRELACHALDTYCQRLKDKDPHLILQCYRSILEIIIQKQDPDLTTKHAGIRHIKKVMRKLKKGHDQPLYTYLSEALRKLGLQPIPEDEGKELEKLLKRWKQLITFHVLRLLTAPVTESLILIDRMLFLYEQGIDSELIPLFDPKLSARNFVLIANKTS
ncbi:methyltransferase-like protein 25B [Glandiceps talaboti]